MNQVLIQLIYFVIYSVVFLVIGKLSFSESDSLSKFFVGERKNDEKRLFFTFVGTWVSAATILGFTGNVYHSGLSVIASSVIPWFIGAGLLYLMTDRLYENDVLSIPQLIGKKHDSKFLQTASAIFMICGYIFYLMIQIKGFGIAVSSLLNINYKVAVFLVYLFILYSSFGGFNSVTKSDCLNLIMLSVSSYQAFGHSIAPAEEPPQVSSESEAGGRGSMMPWYTAPILREPEATRWESSRVERE